MRSFTSFYGAFALPLYLPQDTRGRARLFYFYFLFKFNRGDSKTSRRFHGQGETADRYELRESLKEHGGID